MLKKLKSLLRIQTLTLWPLILKSFLWGILLGLFSWQGGIFWLSLFLATSFYLYFIKPVERGKFLYSFLILVFYAPIVIKFLGDFYPRVIPNAPQEGAGIYLSAIAVAGFSLLWFFLLGSKELLFIRRGEIFNFISGLLYFLIAAVYFAAVANPPSSAIFLFYFLATALAFYFLSREIFRFYFPDLSPARNVLFASVLSFLISEILILTPFLPIGFLNSAILIILAIFILEDLIFYHLRGKLDFRIIANNVIILIAGIFFIFLTLNRSL